MRRFGSTLFAVLLFASHASAQSASELNDQGVQALGAGRYDDAVKALDAAYRKDPKPAVLYNLGLAYKGGGHPDRALEAFENYVKFADSKKDSKTIQAVRAEIERLRTSYARFVLKLTPSDAQIEIDRVPVQASHGELWVQTGKHKISVRANNYESYDQPIDVAAGRFDLEIHLRELTGPPEVRAATLIDEGVALQGAGNLEGAIDKFNAAEAIYPTGRAEALLGLAEESNGDLPSAFTHLDLALKKTKDKYVKTNKKKLTSARTRVKGQLASLNIGGSPLGAEVFINGKSVGILPIVGPVPVAAGSLTITAKKQGYEQFEQLLDLPKRSVRNVLVSMNEAPPPPPPPPVVLPLPPPKPVSKPEAAPEQPIPALAPVAEPPRPAQADIESNTEPKPPEIPELLGPKPSATGFEMAFNFGYQRWIGGPKTDGSSYSLNPQLVFGARLLWPLSFGLQINGGFDPGVANATVIVNVNPGFYVRAHTQQHKEEANFDVWAGAGIQPLAVQVAVLKANPSVNPDTNPNTIDPNSAEARLLRANAGVDRGHTVQSVNLPFELGATFYISEGFGIDLATALTLWLPVQSCLHSNSERLCTENGLKTQTSLFIGGGVSILP